MKFCMITTFYGAHSFGGDAAYVDRLARALVRRGHEVHVVHCADAFEAVRGAHPLRPFTPPPEVRIHTLRSRLGILSPLWTQQTGQPGLKAAALRQIVESSDFDVIHFHNISLVGGPGILHLNDRSRQAVKLMTAHEHWLICPMHLLWKLDRQTCDTPECVKCTLHGRRPVQLWRSSGMRDRALDQLDALICPSRHTLEIHRERGIRAPMLHIPYFLPDDWAGTQAAPAPPPAGERPYFAAAGRLVKLKGFQRLIPLMAQLPHVDLRLAGTGPYEPELRQLAANLPNVHFLGLLGAAELAGLYRNARAVVVPSLFYETFGYVALEAFSVGTPAIVHRLGALPEVTEASGGGFAYASDAELVDAMRRLAHDDALRARLAERGHAARISEWSEATHMERYFSLIEKIRSERRERRVDGRILPTKSGSPAPNIRARTSREATRSSL